jgi:hypothetical protein
MDILGVDLTGVNTEGRRGHVRGMIFLGEGLGPTDVLGEIGIAGKVGDISSSW